MSELAFALPVSVEQIAVAVRQMSPGDKQRLLELVPDLSRLATKASSDVTEQVQVRLAHLQAEVLAAVNGQLLSPDEPFVAHLTLGQYHGLVEEERARLWDEWAALDLMQLQERDVDADALLAG